MSSLAESRGSVGYVTLLTFVAALGGLLFGYDTAVISGAIGFLDSHFSLDQMSKGWATACALLGCALGAAMAGMLSDRFGRKGMLILSALLFLGSSVGTAFPPNFTAFWIFRIMAGLGIGAASMTSPMYIAEVTPARIRGRMVSVNQLAIVFGFIAVYLANYYIADYGSGHADPKSIATSKPKSLQEQRESIHKFIANAAKYNEKAKPEAIDSFMAEHAGEVTNKEVVDFLTRFSITKSATEVELARRGLVSWNVTHGWRWMFAAGILPSGLFLLLLLLVPESPRWLVKQRREDEAQVILARVGGTAGARTELSDIRAALAEETGSVSQLFMPGMRIALMIGVSLAVLQQITGVNVFGYYAPEIFKQLGYGTNAALGWTVWLGVIDLFFTVIAIWTVDRLGRKPLMIAGSLGMGICLVLMGFAFLLGDGLAPYVGGKYKWMLGFMLGYKACFALSVGPITWVILSEIFPTGIRGRAMAIATVCLWVANYFVIQTFPMMNESPWLIRQLNHAFPFWLYAFFCAVSVMFLWRFVPETKGKTLEEIERSWMHGAK